MVRDEIGGPSGAPRRQFLRAGGLLAAGAGLGTSGSLALQASSVGAHAASPEDGRIALTRSRAAGIHLAEIALGVRAGGLWTSPAMSTDEFALLGFSWPAHAPTPSISVRYRSGGAWQPWRALPVLDDRPDPDDEATLRHATQPLWVGSANGVQVRVDGHRPASILLSLIRPDVAIGDVALARPASSDTVLGRPSTTARRTGPTPQPGVVARPTIFLRGDWGAVESWRSGSPSYNDTIQQVHVHHTVSGNDYTRDETPGLIRGMYYYHTHTLGWSDIGYNFLVDRFGRIWEGRAGGAARLVRGAHTLGFNTTSCGISVIGNLEVTQPSDATIAGVAAVAAWKLSTFGRNPLGTTKVVSEGSDKFSRNKAVTLPVIDGHRDTNDTACPGKFLYARLDDVRTTTKALMDAAGDDTPTTPTPRAVTITTPYVVTGEAVVGAALTVSGGAATPAGATASYVWLRDGVPIKRATKAVRQVMPADLGRRLSVVVTLAAQGYESASQTVQSAGPVRYRPSLVVTRRGSGDQLSVRVAVAAVTATGAAPTTAVDPGGSVRITLDADPSTTRTVAVSAGRAETAFTVPIGAHTVQVDYLGSTLVTPGSGSVAYFRKRTRVGARRDSQGSQGRG